MIGILNEDTMRGLVNKANSLGIQKEDILHIQKENGYYVMVYWRHE
jgi:hypothetical protein